MCYTESQKEQQYEETLEALQDHLGNQHLANAYHSRLKMRTQHVAESLQELCTEIKQVAHHTNPALPENHVRRAAGKAFNDKV
jgi:hypothetical protein